MRQIRFIAEAVLWFDKANGNTYHSVKVTDVGTGAVLYCPREYGYGETYRQTALIKMAQAGWIPSDYTTDLNDRTQKNVFKFERENDYPIEWKETTGTRRQCDEHGTPPKV